MTVALYTFVSIDGTPVEINVDRIDYMNPYQYSLPTGVFVGTIINVDQQNVVVRNSLSDINSVITSITVPLTTPSLNPPTYPTVMGSSQIDPFRLVERRYYELSTMHNSLDGMSARIFFSSVVTNPPWLGGSSVNNGNFGWGRYSDLPPQEFRDYRSWETSNVKYIGKDTLPFRNDASIAINTTLSISINNYNNLALGIP